MEPMFMGALSVLVHGVYHLVIKHGLLEKWTIEISDFSFKTSFYRGFSSPAMFDETRGQIIP